MKNPKHIADLPKRSTPVALPLKLGMADGSNANLVTDASNDVIGQSYEIPSKLTVEEARKLGLTAPHVERVEYMLRAINQYETLVAVLQFVAATSSQPRLIRLANEALKEAGEIK